MSKIAIITSDEYNAYLKVESAADKAEREAKEAKWAFVPVFQQYSPPLFNVVVYEKAMTAIVSTQQSPTPALPTSSPIQSLEWQPVLQ